MTESLHAFDARWRLAVGACHREALRAIETYGPHHLAYDPDHAASQIAVLTEEVDELVAEMSREPVDPQRIYEEAIQVAQVAIRVAMAARTR